MSSKGRLAVNLRRHLPSYGESKQRLGGSPHRSAGQTADLVAGAPTARRGQSSKHLRRHPDHRRRRPDGCAGRPIAKIAPRRHPNCAVPEMKSLAAIPHTGGPRSLSRFPGRCLARLTRRGQAVRALFSARRNVLPVPWAFAGHMNEYCAVFGCRGMAAAMRSHVEPSCSDGLFAAGALRVGGHMFLTSLASLSRPSLSAPSTQDVAGLGQLDARRIVSLLFRELFQAVKEVVWGVVAAAAALKP